MALRISVYSHISHHIILHLYIPCHFSRSLKLHEPIYLMVLTLCQISAYSLQYISQRATEMTGREWDAQIWDRTGGLGFSHWLPHSAIIILSFCLYTAISIIPHFHTAILTCHHVLWPHASHFYTYSSTSHSHSTHQFYITALTLGYHWILHTLHHQASIFFAFIR
jgi:hypothetical protein